MWFLFDEIGLIIVIVGCFFGGFLPLLILIMICPEAREHIKCRVSGGVIVEKFYDTGQVEYVVAKERAGEGQYVAGKNAFGQREIYLKTRIGDRFMTKPFLLKGMRRLKFFAYAGKTPIVNHETMLAIEAVEAPTVQAKLSDPVRKWFKSKHPSVLTEFDELANNGGLQLREKALPPDVQDWVENNGLHITEPIYEDVEQPKIELENGVAKVVGTEKVNQQTGLQDVYYPLTDIDPRKLKTYFSDHYDESQIDNLLESARIEGLQEGREGKRFQLSGLAKIALAFIVIAVIGGIVVIGLQGGL